MAKKRTFDFGRLKLFVLIGVLIYASITFVNQQSVLTSQLQRQSALTEQEESLQREIEYQKNKLDYIGTDDYVEQEARTRFGWLKPGETKYVEGNDGSVTEAPIVDPQVSTPSSEVSSPPSETTPSPEESSTPEDSIAP